MATSMWRRAMHYLGLGPDDEYDDYDALDDGPAPVVSRYAPPPQETPSAVRPLPREPEPRPEVPPASPTMRPRGGGVVRPITPQAASAKPHAVSPLSFNEAQEVADKFMAGIPVIVNLQGVEKELSRRLVDFASGLCYGLRGQMERVTNQVYLLTPSNVSVSDETKRRLQDEAT
ncbi:MAG TPA: cell division protein SepF [Acidimicrobiales bacterium]|nr:cell division protein SepF [Acidimicrobiales bacterium]